MSPQATGQDQPTKVDTGTVLYIVCASVLYPCKAASPFVVAEHSGCRVLSNFNDHGGTANLNRLCRLAYMIYSGSEQPVESLGDLGGCDARDSGHYSQAAVQHVTHSVCGLWTLWHDHGRGSLA
jgi:hypothetical protein